MKRVCTASLILSLLCAGAFAVVPPRTLERAIGQRVLRVEELAELKRLADLRGAKIFLFGGSAAALAHYVRWELERERGDANVGHERFDYTFLSVYRPGQDADVLVDGTAEDIAFIGAAIRKRYPYLTGDKDKWELRSLRQTIGDKEAVLGNRNFSDQHTDRHSTAVVALNPAPGEPVVRDALDWDAKLPPFLEDAAGARARFRFSAAHGTTSRAQKGLNPPILSVIRYFIKVSQFRLKVRREDRAVLRRIIDAWDPNGEESTYVAKWFEKNAFKIVDFSIDLAHVWNEMDRVGLRDKLVERGEDFALWFSKEPLRDASDPKHLEPKGAPGLTAKGWGVTRVAHGAKGHQAYDNLRRSPYGVATVFISRKGHKGENAGAGSGFYTKPGDLPGKNTGWNLFYRVDADARENVDFFIDNTGAWVWLTRDKLHAEPTQKAFDVEKAIDILMIPRLPPDNGLREQMAQRLDQACLADADVREYVATQIDFLFEPPPPHAGTLKYFLTLKAFVGTERWKEWMRQLSIRDTPNHIGDYLLTLRRLASKGFAPTAEAVEAVFQKGILNQQQDVLLDLPLDQYPQAVEWVLRVTQSQADKRFVLHPAMLKHPQYRDYLRRLAVGETTVPILHLALTAPTVMARDDWFAMVDDLFERDEFYAFSAAMNASVTAIWSGRPEWPELVEMMLRKRSPFLYRGILERILTLERVRAHPDWSRWVKTAVRRGERAAWTFLQEHRDAEAIVEWEEAFFGDATAIVALDGLAEIAPEGERREVWHRWFGNAVDRAERHHGSLIASLVTKTSTAVDAGIWLPAVRRFAARSATSHGELRRALPESWRDHVLPEDWEPNCAVETAAVLKP